MKIFLCLLACISLVMISNHPNFPLKVTVLRPSAPPIQKVPYLPEFDQENEIFNSLFGITLSDEIEKMDLLKMAEQSAKQQSQDFEVLKQRFPNLTRVPDESRRVPVFMEESRLPAGYISQEEANEAAVSDDPPDEPPDIEEEESPVLLALAPTTWSALVYPDFNIKISSSLMKSSLPR